MACQAITTARPVEVRLMAGQPSSNEDIGVVRLRLQVFGDN